jgi:flavin reductase (DIM6/NTAB) family NADH-FMN oxidoreductase RutF
VPSEPTSREFRDSVGMFTTGITVLTATSDRFGHGMTANAFASVSLDPLLVLVCVVRDALMHKVLEETGRFAVSVLAAEQEDLARYFSDSGRPTGMAQFLPVAWHPGPVTGAPLLDGALAHLECDRFATYRAGDHTLIIGRVIGGSTGDGRPLLYYRGGYGSLE